ncbi:hypothetical protein OSB04_009777 [Centaurea solstitialis]|uniref:Integrase catalytic domain-containing protein n=1 Tax=Centaurea solstitialis TaxID=347529 RepID=A0AA38T695_9ASTR|nr:hypothetical protein OSB04_009777 [Centaurea solstitialis]
MATGDASSFSPSTLLHMLTIKLSSTNYLLWKKQILPLLAYQKLSGHIDGSIAKPPSTITTNDATNPNPAYATWLDSDQRALILIQSSVSEEAMSEVLGLDDARSVWRALEAAYSHDSVERMQTLRDSLRTLQKGNSSVVDYGRKFKTICDQLSAIGHPVDDMDKSHWFLCGLGPSFETFSTTQRVVKPSPAFRDLLSQAEGHELFLQSIHGSSAPQAAFTATQNRSRTQPQIGVVAGALTAVGVFQVAEAGVVAHLIVSSVALMSQCHVHDSSPDWYVDSGATAHMTPSPSNLDTSKQYKGQDHVSFGNGTSLSVSRIGHSSLPNNIKLLDVLVVPHLTKNLLSISKLTNDQPIDVLFSDSFFVLQNRLTKDILARGRVEHGLYILEQGHKSFLAKLSSTRLLASFELWHNRLGHVAFDVISFLAKTKRLSLTSILPAPHLCSSCQLAKSKRLPFDINPKRSLHVLDLVHCDLWGPAPVMSKDGYRYYIIFVDDFSRFTWFYPLKSKSEVFTVLSSFVTFVQTQFSRKLKAFQSDGGTEFLNSRVHAFFVQNGTHHRTSCPYTPQQNGRAERKHRHLTETGLALLFNAHAPASFWVDAFTCATYIINRLPTRLLDNKSPFEVLFNTPPNYGNFRMFGCRVFPYLRDYSPHKLAPRSLPCVFIGYDLRYKGYRCLDLSTSRIYTTRHAQFDETILPFTGSSSGIDSNLLQFNSFMDEPAPSLHDPPTSSLTPSLAPQPAGVPRSSPPPSLGPSSPLGPTPCHLCPASDPSSASIPLHDSDDPPSPDSNATSSSSTSSPPPPPSKPPPHPMTTRSRTGSLKPRRILNLSASAKTPPCTRYLADFSALTQHALHVALFSGTEPKGYKSAAKDPGWLSAMQEEIKALQMSHTWDLVPRPTGGNIVGSKWVFRTKYHSDGSIERLKARLVAQGFTQVPGLDYSLTFSPVVKASTVRIVLSLAVLNKWHLHQLDVKNAFLNGQLSETVFMEQPPGFVDPRFPNHVCRLKKALYGLKQAPRAWFQRLSGFLAKLGFLCSRADTSLFVFHRGSCIMYLLVYVDDLILTGNQPQTIRTFISRLNQEFAIKDLGRLSYFLGLEVTYSDNGLFLNQSKYAHDVLVRAGLLSSKPVATPLSATDYLSTTGNPFSDPTTYRSLVGALQYLTITRPDLSYAVNQVSQFLHAPTVDHFQAVKRILRYVKGTISFGLMFTHSPSPTVLGYSDADWARCLETRRSTYGYSIFLGGNLISWSAKKQPTVSRSSCESEYRAMANTAAEIVWVTHLLRELHVLPPDRPTLLCDNRSAIFLSQNPVSHKRAKHIDIDYHFVRELVSSGKLYTRFVPTKLQLADIFTKSLPRPLFEHFRTKLRVGPPPIRLKGGIKDNNDVRDIS